MSTRKPSKKTLTAKLDRICSKIVRSHGVCMKCGNSNYEKLQCCHIFSRTYRNTRWSFLNLLCLCSSCHFWSHRNPILFAEFVKDLLGDRYETLKQEAQKVKKWSVGEMEEMLETLEKSFEESYP